jgi:hypothetical protein
MRDEFSEEVKRTVAQRVGYRCSKPDCRADTSGPQIDPTKALNVGVAAHITAASPGGARYNPSLSAEERSHPSNAIWLCQTCAKLIDNDAVRFPVSLLLQWKAEAENSAFSTIGRTAVGTNATSGHAQSISRLQPGAKIRIRPAIPRRIEQEDYFVEGPIEPDCIKVTRSAHHLRIPSSAIATVHLFGDQQPPIVILDGRLQWITATQRWEFLPEKPPSDSSGDYGLPRYVDFQYPQREGITDRFAVRWFREDGLQSFLGQGWNVFYDRDGRYLRVSGPDIDQVLLSQRP